MSKVILVVCDALRDDTAREQMGYLEHLVEAKAATRYKVIGELPSMSRPMYETLHTGVPASKHGVTNNRVVRRSKMPNVFQVATENNKTTAAAAYGWVSDLYNRAPYDPIDDREVDDPNLPIQHGRFYIEDSYPDSELFAAAGMLVRKFQPDYLLVHPMGMDYLGHTYSSDSQEYRNNAIKQDQIMANLIPEWLEAGYIVIVTADHGMTSDKMHGGTSPEVRHVPLYFIPPDGQGKGDTNATLSQLQIAPTVCYLLGLPIPETMAQTPFV